jgi:hypothetical protein
MKGEGAMVVWLCGWLRLPVAIGPSGGGGSFVTYCNSLAPARLPRQHLKYEYATQRSMSYSTPPHAHNVA